MYQNRWLISPGQFAAYAPLTMGWKPVVRMYRMTAKRTSPEMVSLVTNHLANYWKIASDLQQSEGVWFLLSITA